jgi:hypothetical protein
MAAGRHRPRGLPPPLTIATDLTDEAAYFAFPLPLFSRAPRCSALCQLLLRLPLPITDKPSKAVRPGQKECLFPAPLLHQEPT